MAIDTRNETLESLKDLVDVTAIKRAGQTNKFLRVSAYVAMILGALQLCVNVLGRTTVWIIELRAATKGTPFSGDLPEPPWNIATAIFGFVILSIVGYAFWSNQIGEPGKVVDLITTWLPWKKAQTGSDDE